MRRKKKLEPYTLLNWARARHSLDTKTNLGASNTRTTTNTHQKISPPPKGHGIRTHILKPAYQRTDPTPIPTNITILWSLWTSRFPADLSYCAELYG